MEAVAIYDFKATADDELSFKKSQLLKIINLEVELNWYEAELDGKKGLIPCNYVEMREHNWYDGKITRADAEKQLLRKHEGAFLIRNSESSPGEFSLSVKCSDGVQHYKVHRDGEGKFFVRVVTFNSLNDLVRHYSWSSVSCSQKVRLRDMVAEEFFVIPLFDFTSQEQGDLEFKRGDIILVNDRSDKHWWHGVIGRRRGIFPATYVTPYNPS